MRYTLFLLLFGSSSELCVMETIPWWVAWIPTLTTIAILISLRRNIIAARQNKAIDGNRSRVGVSIFWLGEEGN